MIDLGRKTLAGKAEARPDLVGRDWDKAKKEGLLKTYQEILGRLDTPTPIGRPSDRRASVYRPWRGANLEKANLRDVDLSRAIQ